MPNARILLVMAMEREAAAVRTKLGISHQSVPLHRALPPRFFSRPPTTTTPALGLVINGIDERSGLDAIATQPAVISTLLATEVFRPTLVVSAGTAGGFAERGGAVGDVFISADVVSYHDRRIGIPGWDAYGIGSYPVAEVDVNPSDVGARWGRVTTGNSLDAPPVDLATMAELGTDAKEMEAAAVAGVAAQLGVPFLAVKGITDLVDAPEGTAAQFERNLAHTADRVADVVAKLLPTLSQSS